MNKRHFEILEEMITDFDEYSTDYTKTRCKEIEQVLVDTIKYITNLQQRIDKAVEYIEMVQKTENDINPYVLHAPTLLNILKGDDTNES